MPPPNRRFQATLAALTLIALVVVGCSGRMLDSGGGGSPPPATAQAGAGGGADTPRAATPAAARAVFPSVTVDAEVASTEADRARGLGGHAPLGERDGMLFVFERSGRHSFWMKGMAFALDILWIEDGQVVHLEENVPPPAPGTADGALPVYAPAVAARYVLEVNAGFARRYGITTGTTVTLSGV